MKNLEHRQKKEWMVTAEVLSVENLEGEGEKDGIRRRSLKVV